jgi:hypothetical protein
MTLIPLSQVDQYLGLAGYGLYEGHVGRDIAAIGAQQYRLGPVTCLPPMGWVDMPEAMAMAARRPG